MKATGQYFPVLLFIMLYKEVLTFESVDEILMCDHSNGHSCGAVYFAVQSLNESPFFGTVSFLIFYSIIY